MEDDSKDPNVMQDPSRMQAALNQLAEALTDAKFRSSFADDPPRATTAAGITVDDLPRGLLETLAGMSDHELEIVGKVHQSLKDGLADSFPDSSRICILF